MGQEPEAGSSNQAAVRQAGRHARSRNAHGEGERLREELLEAAERVLARTGDEGALSLRAVAREAGVAAPSVYLRFPDKDALMWTVMERQFDKIFTWITGARAGLTDPAAQLRAGCLGYCAFGLGEPGTYRLLFGNIVRQGGPPIGDDERLPGQDTFEDLVAMIAACVEAGAAPPQDPFPTAVHVWTALHGIVTLRPAVPRFPWPTVEEQVTTMLRRVVGVTPPEADASDVGADAGYGERAGEREAGR